MANSNKKLGQGKTPQQYEDSSRFAWYSVVCMIILLILASLLSSCVGTYYITDAEYNNTREEHLAITYHNNSIYWGWNNGYYYYYGKPHYYPWTYYYNTCPPSHHNPTTHVVINRPVKRPTHRPKISTHRSNIIKTNTNHNTNVIIKTNNGSKRTNKTTIRKRPKK